jgi:hypothetical protein
MPLGTISALGKNVVVCCGVIANNAFSPSCNLTFPTYNYTGHPLGIIDSNGKVIVAPAYSRITYLEHGLYLTKSAGIGAFEGSQIELFNRDGRKLEVKVPAGTEFYGVYYLGSVGKLRSSLAIDTLPPDAVVIFRRNGRYGLCTTTGDEVLEAKFGTIDSVNGGQPLMFDMAVRMTYPDRENGITPEDARQFKSNKAYYFDVEKKELVPLELTGVWSMSPEYSDGMRSFCSAQTKNLHGFINERGREVIKPRYWRYEPFEDGRAIVTRYPCVSGSQYGDRYIIDKQEKRISPRNAFVTGRQNGVYFTGMKKSAGLMDRNGKWLYGPEDGSIRVKPDGTLMHSDRASARFTVISSTGQVLKRMTGNELNDCYPPVPVTIRCIPKQSGAREVEFSKWAGAQSVARNMLWFYGRGNETLGMEYTTYPATVFIGKELSKKQIPYVARARFESDRYAMIAPGYMGKFNPEELRMDTFCGTTPTDMFARFLREYNLFCMSRDEVVKLLAEGNKWAALRDNTLVLGIISGGCVVDHYYSVQIHFNGDKVSSWNFIDGNNNKSPSITMDVELFPTEVTEAN